MKCNFFLWGGIGLVLFTWSCHTDKVESRKYDFSLIENKVQSWVDQGFYSGASILIAKKGEFIYEDYFGDYDSATVVYIASAGKWLAAATIASVVEDGVLSWDDPVRKWLPEFKDVKGEATLRQLMSHTSGYPDYQPQGVHPDDYQTLEESVANIVDLPADTLPGVEFHYGGLAMQVAGRMAELAAGEDFEVLFQQRIAQPLGMRNTHFTPVDPAGGHNPLVGGGARSTLHDYARFLDMILNKGTYKGKKILNTSSVVEMESDQIRGANTDKDDYVKLVREGEQNGIYGLGEWREELDAVGQATLISSPSWAGAYPWVDRKNHVYGFMLAHVIPERAFPEGFSSFHSSPMLALMTREIISAEPDKMAHFAPVQNGQLYYETKGAGEPMILIHGHSFDARMWDGQFDSLANHYQVIRYDLRGYGRSSEPDSGQSFMHAKDLVSLMDYMKIDKAHLVGLSLGSFVTGDMLALYPDRVLSASLASGAVYDHAGPSVPFSDEEIAQRKLEISQLKKAGQMTFKKSWFNALMDGAGSKGENIRQPMWEMIYEWAAWQPLNIEPRLLLGYEVLEKIGKVDCPVLFIYAEFDSEGSHRSSDLLADKIPHAQKVWIKDAGHMSNMEQPEWFTEVVLKMLKE